MNHTFRVSIPFFERLSIEPHALCNRTCWFCPRTYDRAGGCLDACGRPVHARMSTERIIDLLDQTQDMGFREQVTFPFYCEPLLDRRNPQLAREARRSGMKPYPHPSGDPLRGDDDLCRAVEEIYDYVVIGLYDYQTEEQKVPAQAD